MTPRMPFLFSASLLFFSTQAMATLIDLGGTTIDSETGLEWLDLPMSIARSYDDLVGNDGSNEFAPNGDFRGWRYATITEVHDLFVNAGIPDINHPSSTAANVPSVSALIGLVGQTTVGLAPGAFGTTSTPLGFDTLRYVGVLQIFVGGQSATANTENFSIGNSEAAPLVGNWLVRSAAVPEPHPILVIAAGLVLIAAGRCRQSSDEGSH